ncbi:uncharacterized protein LOC141706709 [Apium graveolens]|uniref:uncharacterized protein LOC141706709 n=1 Tax=Apium graveolens TaxID=4045 RepID=UPI003D7AB17F
MQGGRGAMSSVMEAAANIAASAKSGLDKTKAVVEEKKERMSTSDAVEKDMASLRKEEKIDLAELRKCKAYAQNAVAAATPTGSANPGFTDGGEFDTIGSFTQQPAAVAAPAPDSFVTGKVGSAGNASDINSTGNANVGGSEVVDTNPTHTGMPAPVVEPDGVGSGFRTDTNTGSGTHFGMK